MRRKATRISWRACKDARPVEAIYGRPESFPTEGSGGIPRPLSQPPTGASTDFPPAFVGRPRVAGPRSLRRAPRRARAAGRSTSRCTGGARHCVGPVQMCVSERGSFDGDHRGLHGRRLDRGPAPGRRRPAAGLVAMSHGFGNKRAATMQTASRRPGVNVNMLQADRGRDPRAAQRLVPAVRCAGTRFFTSRPSGPRLLTGAPLGPVPPVEPGQATKAGPGTSKERGSAG